MNDQEKKTMWKITAYGAGGMVLTALVLWWLITSIPPSTYIAMRDELRLAGDILLWAAAIGQTGFVLMWMSLPWWTHWVGRALMVKSLALMIYLDIALVLDQIDYFYGLYLLTTVLFGFIVLGIWSQFITIAHERLLTRDQIVEEPVEDELDPW